MDGKHSDIFVIGGGINGVGIANDAAGRGLSVTLAEKNDLASGTSSASSKLIHGGLRYLELYEFNLVRKALLERDILLRKAPHLISPLEFIIPYEKHLRPAWMIRLGLFLYDHLTSLKNLSRSTIIKLKKNERGHPLLTDFKIGFSYYDCQVDDARLVILNAIQAKDHGAMILTRTEFLSARYENNAWHIQLLDKKTQQVFEHTAALLINATGPWISEVQKNIIDSDPLPIVLDKGSHILVPKLYAGNYAYLLQNNDKRIIFTIPYQENFTLIGTTDIPHENPSIPPCASADEKNYLCDVINQYFKNKISTEDIVWEYSGIRCLIRDHQQRTQNITRDYQLTLQTLQGGAQLTVIGGKVTTYRKLAEEALEKIKPFFPQMKSTWTASASLPGGDIPNGNVPLFFAQLKKDFLWLPDDILWRYVKNYGTRAYQILNDANALPDLGHHWGHGLYQKEVDYLIQQEWAVTAEDILWRRSKLGLFFSVREIEKLQDYLSALPCSG